MVGYEFWKIPLAKLSTLEFRYGLDMNVTEQHAFSPFLTSLSPIFYSFHPTYIRHNVST